jgi:hypothetical protein
MKGVVKKYEDIAHLPDHERAIETAKLITSSGSVVEVVVVEYAGDAPAYGKSPREDAVQGLWVRAPFLRQLSRWVGTASGLPTLPKTVRGPCATVLGSSQPPPAIRPSSDPPCQLQWWPC